MRVNQAQKHKARTYGEVDLLLREEASKELGGDAKGTSTREGLNRSNLKRVLEMNREVEVQDQYLAFLQRSAVLSKEKLSGNLCEAGLATNGSVLVVRVGSDNLLLCLLHAGEYEGLAIVITVCAHTKVLLPWIGVLTKSNPAKG